MRQSMIFRNGELLELMEDQAIEMARSQDDVLLWLDIQDPDDAAFRLLCDRFQFHPLAVEDAIRRNQRAKVDQYPGHSLMVLYDLEWLEAEDTVRANQLTIFVGARFVVTVHKGRIRSVDELRERLRLEPSILEPHPLSLLVYSIADGLVDDYFLMLDRYDEELAELEERLFDQQGRELLPLLFTLRKSLMRMRRLVNQMRDVFNILIRRDQAVFHEYTLPYYTDVYDHLLRISDTLEIQRDLLTGALETYLSIQSNELNQTVRKLTSLTVIVMVPTLIAGIYGMNFSVMPELNWALGYPFALGLMVVSSLVLFVLLRRVRWI